ncbi:MAG: OmpA family protein, partial [Parapedobacter sp.]
MKKLYESLLVIAIILLPAGFTLAQEQVSVRDRADELFRRYEYANAAKLYAHLVDTRRPRLLDLQRLAASYWLMNDYEAAESWYARVVVHEASTPEDRLAYADALKVNGKYAEAKKQLQTYIDSTGDASRVSVQLAGCDSAIRWMAAPSHHRLRNEGEVNTERSEFSAYAIQDQVYFVGEPASSSSHGTYGWTGHAYLRVFSSPLSLAGTLGTPALAGTDLNNAKYHVGPVAGTANGDTLYVTRTHTGKRGEVRREGRKRYQTQKLALYSYRKVDGQWVEEPFTYSDPEKYSLGHAALAADGATLYFSSDMPGGHGGTDIWYCERQPDATWGTPINAGPVINSAGDELFPTIAPDGTLYYASDGFAGMGGLDIFAAVGGKTQWTTSYNLGYPVNSAADDFAYLVVDADDNGFRGFLSSDRRGGKGGDDIYSFSYTEPKIVIILQGTTSDQASGERLPAATVTLYDGKREIVAKRSSDAAGTFEFILEIDQSYTVLG